MNFSEPKTYEESFKEKWGDLFKKRNLNLKLSDFHPWNGFENFSRRTNQERKSYNEARELEHAVKGLILLTWNLIPRIPFVPFYETYRFYGKIRDYCNSTTNSAKHL